MSKPTRGFKPDNKRSLQTLLRAISLSQGQFSLILVLCNHAQLQRRVWEQVQNQTTERLKLLFIPDSAASLYQSITTVIGDEHPEAVMVLGLESVKQIDELLASSNRLRDRFPKQFSFPIVLFLNENILQKMVRVAHDFYSWAGTPIEFCSSTEELIDFLEAEAQVLFEKILEAGADRFLDNTALNFGMEAGRRFEIQIALRELARRGIYQPTLEASQKFMLGRDAYASGNLAQARNLYEQSLALWERCTADSQVLPGDTLLCNTLMPSGTLRERFHLNYQSCLERQACLLFHLGLWWRRYATEHRLEYDASCQRSYDYYSRCLEVLKSTDREELVAKFINPLGEILQQLKRWDELQLVAKKAIQLHLMYPHSIRLARAYGFLAEVTLAQSQWEEAKFYAEKALKTNNESVSDSYLLTGLQELHQSRYLLQLAKSQRQLDRIQAAREHLETAKAKCQPAFHPQLYINILEELRSLYFQDRLYLAAFEIKQEQRSIEQQYGFRAFIGAGRLQPQKHVLHPAIVTVLETTPTDGRSVNIAQEILNSGRRQNIEDLIYRLQRNDYKLTVIYGPSGVGKSSLITAGLVPSLTEKTAIEGQRFLPVILRLYHDWVQELGTALRTSLKQLTKVDLVLESSPKSSLDNILKQLRQNASLHLVTVLIFDQFEEFFFNCKCPQERQNFWAFLKTCLDSLDLPYINTIISIRQDYIHHLLECDRSVNIEVIKNDILNRENRYYIGNLFPQETKFFINSLSRNTYYLEPQLIEQLVKDLSKETQEVRPIELQIVGSQLENENITSLVQYQQIGSKDELVQRFLQEVIRDCGPVNQKIAERVLYFLTNENGTRPLRSKADLNENLEANHEQLDLILDIFVKSGIVLLLPQDKLALYQLVHDYLAALIRQQIGDFLLKELEAEKNLRKQAEYILLILKNRLGIGIVILILIGVVAAILARELISQRNRYLMNSVSYTKTLLDRSQDFEALIEGLKTGIVLKKTIFSEITIKPEIREAAIDNLKKAIDSFKERNRFDNQVRVNTVRFSPQGNSILIGSADGEIKFLTLSGQKLTPIKTHQNAVSSITFSFNGKLMAASFNGKLMAAAGNQGLVTVWKTEGNQFQQSQPYTTRVNSVVFSPDERVLASADNDGNISFWNWQTQTPKAWKAHQGAVNAIDFSPRGQMLASGSTDSKVKLWQKDGKLIKPLKAHTDWVTSIKFSSDNRYLVSGSNDNTVKIWNLTQLNTNNIKPRSLEHYAQVVTLDITSDSQLIAVGTADGLITLWDFQRKKIKSWESHNGGVNSLSFSPDGKLLVSAGNDNQVKIWRLEDAKSDAKSIEPTNSSNLSESNLSELIQLGCEQVKDYLETKPSEDSDRNLCR